LARADDKRFEELLRRRLERKVDEAQCPDASVLAAYYEQTLPAGQRERWEEHFSACARCREGLAALTRIEAADSAQKRASASAWWRAHGLLPAAAAAFGAAAAVAVVVFIRSNSSKLSSRTEIALQSAFIQTELKKEAGSTAASSSGVASPAPQIAMNKAPERHGSAFAPELKASPQEAASPEESETSGALHARRKSAARAKLQGMRDEMAAQPEQNALAKRLDLAERPAMAGGGAAKTAPPPAMTAKYARREATGGPAATAPAVRAGSTGAAGAAGAAPAAPAPAAAAGAAAASSGGGSGSVLPPVPESMPSTPASSSVAANAVSRGTFQAGTLGSGVGATIGSTVARPGAGNAIGGGTSAGRGAFNGSASVSEQTAAAKSSMIAVSPPDHSVVWMIGAHGSISRFIPGSQWLREQSGVEADLTAGAAPSAEACWVVGHSGTIVRTTDGMHWQRISSPTNGDLTAVSAQSASDATVVAADGQRYVTSDGGTTWRAL